MKDRIDRNNNKLELTWAGKDKRTSPEPRILLEQKTEDYLEEIHNELNNKDLLLIWCNSFIGNKTLFNNITIKKIPKIILDKCEWNKSGYPLPIREEIEEGENRGEEFKKEKIIK